MTSPCVQCGKPGIASSGGNNLCVDHAIALQTVLNQQQAHNVAMINMLSDQIDDIMGVPRRSARIEAPTPTIHQGGHYTINDIRIDRSIVGAVNTAQVENIEISMTNLQNQSSEGKEVAESLKDLTEAILENNELNLELKNELVDDLAFLAEQAAHPTKSRQKSIIKGVLFTLGHSLNAVASLATIWTAYERLITNYLIGE